MYMTHFAGSFLMNNKVVCEIDILYGITNGFFGYPILLWCDSDEIDMMVN